LNEVAALEIAKNTMKSIYRYNDELYPKGTQKVVLGHYSGNRIKETVEISSAQLALVDFFRSIDEYPILGPETSKGLMRVMVRKQSNRPDPMNNPILRASYWELETTTQATYPIITVAEAWAAINRREGVISDVVSKESDRFESYSPVQVDKIFINNIYLAYYESYDYQTYLQPMYVFSGTYTARGSEGGEITMYYPAISGEYIETGSREITE
jgi:hypothetical protein